jgi:hypothetical protein
VEFARRSIFSEVRPSFAEMEKALLAVKQGAAKEKLAKAA